MVSAHSEDRSFFRIGLVGKNESRRSRSGANGILFTYVEDFGKAKLSYATLSMMGNEYHFKFTDGPTQYRLNKLEKDFSSEEFAEKVMPRWVGEHTNAKELEFREISNKHWAYPAHLFLLPSLIQQSEKNNEFKFPMRTGPWIGDPVVWIAPIRTKPSRTYDDVDRGFSSEGTHTPYLIKRLLNSKSEANRFDKFIRRVGTASGLFESIQVRTYGDGATAPFEVDAVVDEKALNLHTVGYGVSQALPILVEVLTRTKGTPFAIQQPEVHLHPRAQAALGDVLFEMATIDRKEFFVETHSDFMIDRFRTNYRKKRSNKPKSQVLFFQRVDKRNTATSLVIQDNGDLPKHQPKAYREFFVKEELKVLGL